MSRALGCTAPSLRDSGRDVSDWLGNEGCGGKTVGGSTGTGTGTGGTGGGGRAGGPIIYTVCLRKMVEQE